MKNRNTNNNDDEVERLLEAAKDQVLLDLSVDSHLKSRRLSSDDFDQNNLPSDLLRRFQALKSPSNQSTSTKQPQPRQQSRDLSNQDDDDLFARFAALKAPSSSNSTNPAAVASHGVFPDYVEEDDEKSEVDKIIQWAKDAARLDPSPPSDLDDDDDKIDDDDKTDDDDSDEEDEGVNRKPNRHEERKKGKDGRNDKQNET